MAAEKNLFFASCFLSSWGKRKPAQFVLTTLTSLHGRHSGSVLCTHRACGKGKLEQSKICLGCPRPPAWTAPLFSLPVFGSLQGSQGLSGLLRPISLSLGCSDHLQCLPSAFCKSFMAALFSKNMFDVFPGLQPDIKVLPMCDRDLSVAFPTAKQKHSFMSVLPGPEQTNFWTQDFQN